MGAIRKVEKVKLIIGMIAGDPALFGKAALHLVKIYGPADFTSDIVPFDKTSYYEKEMGRNLQRRFISFKRLILPDKLILIKRQTNKLEFILSQNRQHRAINLDPGYLEYGKLVLATTKDHQHRLYLGQGIFGEVTLRYTNGSFTPWEWTYPDYATQEYINIFNHIRKLYQQQLK
ncbi:MAG: DUF4416 family protein [bacterium]|nr:DUF4416 family protein [bacterium]